MNGRRRWTRPGTSTHWPAGLDTDGTANLSAELQGQPERPERPQRHNREQSASVVQINKAVLMVDEVTQRNASAAEELASTAEELAAQAEALKEMMSFFQVAGSNGAPTRPAQRPTAPAYPHANGKTPPPIPARRALANGPEDADFQRF